MATLRELDRFHLVTAFDAIHDQAHPGVVLANIARSLRPGGVFLMQDIKASIEQGGGEHRAAWATMLYAVSTLHCMSVSLGLGGDGLGTVWGQQLAVSMLETAGFATVEVKEIETDPFNYYYVAHRSSARTSAPLSVKIGDNRRRFMEKELPVTATPAPPQNAGVDPRAALGVGRGRRLRGGQ